MNISIYTVHLFFYECITCKVKSITVHFIFLMLPQIHKNKKLLKNYIYEKNILGGHPVALVGQAKDFHQHHI